MKFYLFMTTEFNDGTKDSKSIYEYETLNEAEANFHKQLGGWMVKDNVSHILAMVINSEGGTYPELVKSFHNNVVPIVEPIAETVEESIEE